MLIHQDLSKAANLSFWELQTYFDAVDFVVVGSGIVGLNAALYLKQHAPTSKVMVIERGILPYGASTKNAGFACFGSASEIISDIALFGEELAIETINMRLTGLQYLRNLLGDDAIQFEACGGYELFFSDEDFQKYHEQLKYLNMLYDNCFKLKNSWSSASSSIEKFGFEKVKGMLLNDAEGSIDTGMMMKSLHKKCIHEGVIVLNNILLKSFQNNGHNIELQVNDGFTFTCKKLLLASNGFTKEIIPNINVTPARAQVLVTKPIEQLKIKGTFHFDEGYYYFRNVGNRVLFGGGRNLDFVGETTTSFQLNQGIQDSLIKYLQEVILPHQCFEIEHQWTGIMGMGENKKPIIQNIGNNISCAVKMGGMGVAIGSIAGVEAAKLIL
jgi:glycine/D-amino acid oxidase-like deaminating enzyme